MDILKQTSGFNLSISLCTALCNIWMSRYSGFSSQTPKVRPKSAIYKRDEVHPRYFYMGVPTGFESKSIHWSLITERKWRRTTAGSTRVVSTQCKAIAIVYRCKCISKNLYLPLEYLQLKNNTPEKLRQNPPGNWVFLILSEQKPWTKII